LKEKLKRKKNMTVNLKINYVAKSRGGDLFVITKVTNDSEFPIKGKKVVGRKATTATDTNNMYTFTKEGRYNLSDFDSSNDLLESRPLKNGESFKYADSLQLVEFLSCHDLVGLFEVNDVTYSAKPDWLK
jgi:hypothetical protein